MQVLITSHENDLECEMETLNEARTEIDNKSERDCEGLDYEVGTSGGGEGRRNNALREGEIRSKLSGSDKNCSKGRWATIGWFGRILKMWAGRDEQDWGVDDMAQN